MSRLSGKAHKPLKMFLYKELLRQTVLATQNQRTGYQKSHDQGRIYRWLEVGVDNYKELR